MEKQELTVLKIEDLRPFPGNPFHLVEDEQLMELSESIKEFGMAAPILTRPGSDGMREVFISLLVDAVRRGNCPVRTFENLKEPQYNKGRNQEKEVI